VTSNRIILLPPLFPSSLMPFLVLDYLWLIAVTLFSAYNLCVALYSLHFKGNERFDAWFEPWIPAFILSPPSEPSTSLYLE